MSERRACRVIDGDRGSVRYRSTRDDDAALREKLRKLANQRRRFGYRRLHILLRREGVMIPARRPSAFIRRTDWRSGGGAAVSVLSGPGRRLRFLPYRTRAGAWTLCMARWRLEGGSAC